MELEELIDSIDIVDFISQYVDLAEKNGEWWGLSPYREERTPSFSVRRETGRWYDFSSGLSGGTYLFLRYLGKTKREAIEELKKFAGYDGKIMAPCEKMEATKCCKSFARQIKEQKPANPTVLPNNYMERYERRPDKLKIWKDEGMSDEVLDIYQVRYDSFSDSIVYPIKDIRGRIINVGYRRLDPQWKEKGYHKYGYINSWNGGMDVIYGLYDNMSYIKSKHEIILFEGVKSVMIAASWGIKNCGALLTSHLSPYQFKILVKLGFDVVFCLDKEIDVRKDSNVMRLKNYVRAYKYWDVDDLLDEKDSPVDKGMEVFEKLYEGRVRL